MEMTNELISINSLYLINKFEVQGLPVLVSHSPLFARYFPLFQVNRFCVVADKISQNTTTISLGIL